MEFKFINHTDSFLAKVIQLGKKNSGTLGLMPKDAYIQQARKRCVVIAFEGDQLLGFCLFRITNTKRRIGITQLCIDLAHRRKGISRLLLDQVRDKYKSLLNGMLVSCREDYKEACCLWNSYGFVSKKRIRSRSLQEKYLFKLWYSFDQKDLFTIEDNPNDLRVVLDLNILIKLRDQDSNAEEIHQLLADWLTDEVDYCYAKETLTEIHRDKDFQRTNSTLQFLSTFQELTCNPTESQQYLAPLKELHSGETENHVSDRKQIAECKASNISYFITIDDELLAHRDGIYEELGINILRPGEFILEIDELKNRRLYEPIRLQGAHYEMRRIDSTGLLSTIDTFLNKELSEKKSEFQNLVLSVTSDTQDSVAKIISSPEGDPISFYGLRLDMESLNVVFVRIKKHPISNTLFSQILVEVIREAITTGKQIIRYTEKNISSEQKTILSNHGFHITGEQWIKIALNGVCESSSLTSNFSIIELHSEISDVLALISNHPDNEIKEKLKLDVERKLWPLKLTDLSIPVFIVPIKPIWASQLFDYLSADTSIFGATPELSWSKENVYYRSHQPNVESFPGRILWYASQEKDFIRQKAIVACSYLNNVVTGEAKQLYSVFRRFGIYKWPEINALAKGDIHKLIKVLQFSDTEVFKRPVSFKTTNEILLSEGFKKQTFVSPVKVNNQFFNRIYTLAKGTA
jgi:predicted nucleic acid-binding protein